MKAGLIFENGDLIYYKDDVPVHAGAIKIDGDIYYINREGKAVKGRYRVHSEMGNGVLKRGFYTFGEDGKLIEGSFAAIEKSKHGKKRISRNTKKKLKALKPYLVGMAVFAVIILGIICFQNEKFIIDRDNDVTSKNENMVELPKFENQVLLCSVGAKSIFDGENEISKGLTFEMLYRPFEFQYDLKGKSGMLYLSEHSDMLDAVQFILDSEEGYLTIDNLKTGTQYFYKVVVDKEEYLGSFQTAESTRFIKLPGVHNTRDIGGYTTLDGKTVKQGMIIRGTEIDGLAEPSYFLDGDYIEYTKNTFGFVYEFDLRQSTLFSDDYKSRLGDDVLHKFYTAPQYGQIFNANYTESLRQIFQDLAKPNNYPMYLHCTYGTDRTGTICFLLEGVLNLPEEVMLNDYGLSGPPVTNLNPIYAGLEDYEGDTIQEKIANYLTTKVGVTNKEIESIRKILLKK